jgi:hypothetical protein
MVVVRCISGAGGPKFAEDHELHQGFFMLFDYHCGTTKFDMKIFDYTLPEEV